MTQNDEKPSLSLFGACGSGICSPPARYRTSRGPEKFGGRGGGKLVAEMLGVTAILRPDNTSVPSIAGLGSTRWTPGRPRSAQVGASRRKSAQVDTGLPKSTQLDPCGLRSTQLEPGRSRSTQADPGPTSSTLADAGDSPPRDVAGQGQR